MARKAGSRNITIHWHAYTPEGELKSFHTVKDLSEWSQEVWGTGPISSEMACRVSRQLQNRNLKMHCPVGYRYGAMGLRKIEWPPGFDQSVC